MITNPLWFPPVRVSGASGRRQASWDAKGLAGAARQAAERFEEVKAPQRETPAPPGDIFQVHGAAPHG